MTYESWNNFFLFLNRELIIELKMLKSDKLNPPWPDFQTESLLYFTKCDSQIKPMKIMIDLETLFHAK